MLHPWAIAIGVAALAGPLLVHLLTRPRPTRLPLSTIRFVKEVVEQRRARNRLRDWLVLLLRMAAVALLAAAIARPLVGDRSQVTLNGPEGRTLRVVLLDVSQSMAAEKGGVRTFERARAVAARQFDGFGTQMNLILAGATPQTVFDRLSSNAAALRDALAKAGPLPERLNVQPALNKAAELLAVHSTAPAQIETALRRELVIVSDFQRSNWTAADFSVLPVDTAIQLESVAPEDAPANLALLRVGPREQIEQGREFRLEVDVGNYSSSQRKVDVELALGESIYHLTGVCPPGVKTTVGAEAMLREPGWQVGEARLLAVDDALAADDHRAVAVEVRRPPTYLLVTRQRSGAQPNSSYFLQRALAPFTPREGRPSETVVRGDPASLETEAFAAADLIVIDHPGKLPETTLRMLASLMLRGRGVLYVAAEPTDATNLSLLADAAGASLQMPVEFLPPQGGQNRRNLFIADFSRREPPWTAFGDEATAAISPLRFSGGLPSRRLEGALIDDVRATFDDDSACLVVTSVGAGRLAVLNADLGASNLPASPAFVPLLGDLVANMLGQDRTREAVPCGEPTANFLPVTAGAAEDLQIEPPASAASNASLLGEFKTDEIGVLWQVPAAAPPGVYRIHNGDHRVFALATAIPAEESDLTPLAASVLTERMLGGRIIRFHAAAQDDLEPSDELWTWFALGCVVCLVGEAFVLRLFRS